MKRESGVCPRTQEGQGQKQDSKSDVFSEAQLLTPVSPSYMFSTAKQAVCSEGSSVWVRGRGHDSALPLRVRTASVCGD